jgi:hypothetical protein
MSHRSIARLLGLAASTCLVTSLVLSLGPRPAEAYPTPSPYPKSWELDFTHSMPKRIVVEIPGSAVPQAYWYITYNVVNKTDHEQMFLPDFELLTRDGQVIRSDNNIPEKVFQAIKLRERIKYLQSFPAVTGVIRIGDDEAKDGVAIWPEPDPRMDKFSVFIQGLSGETVILTDDQGKIEKDSDGKPIILRKTLQLDYQIRSDGMYNPGQGVIDVDHKWIMR